MLPAIERCSLILSRFSGIAKFHGANSSLGFTTQQINTIMDSVACLHLVSSKILIQVVDELELFTSFSSWLRYEIDRLASDVSASPTDDAVAEKETSIDHSKVLSYVQTAMTSSPLAVYLGDSSEEFTDNWSHGEHGMPIYDLLDKQLQKQERGLPYIKSLPRVEVLCKLLTRQASTIFSQIAEAEKRNVLFGKVYDIGSAEVDAPLHMRIIAEVS
jgi:anaphase-promoting complex subunit 4